ncbi:MAG: endonuclease/exonuclease/phosphatase family protein [Candidatus Krumholzibacteriia bacterium]
MPSMPAQIRIVTYNIQRAIHLSALLELFESAPAFRDADIVAIQEATYLPDGRNVLERLAHVLSPDHLWTYRTVMAYPDKEYGNGFLFRQSTRVLASRPVPLPVVTRLRWYEKQKTEGGRPDTKSALVQTFQLGDWTIRVANVHLDFAGGWRHRRTQLDHLLEAVDAEGDRPEPGHDEARLDVVCGDFNTVGQYRLPPARRDTRRSLAAATRRGYVDATAGIRYTSDLFGSIDPADPAGGFLRLGRRGGMHFRQKTDHVLVRGHVMPASSRIVDHPESELFEISDHLPIELTLRPR